MKLRTILIGIAAACAINYEMTYWLARVAVFAEKVKQDEYCATPLPQIPTPLHAPDVEQVPVTAAGPGRAPIAGTAR